jgi:UDP-N-acetylmuramyl pentapeptide synthase
LQGNQGQVLGRDFHSDCVAQDLGGVTARLGSLGVEVRLGMLGRYQCQNAAVAAEMALEAGRSIDIPLESIADGLSRPGGRGGWTWSADRR